MCDLDWTGAFHPRRVLGRTGFIVSRLGIGDLADRSVSIDRCVATVRRAIDAGLNLIDTAPGYEDGYSEEIVGKALRDRRDSMFLIDKIDHHDRPVLPQVERSLGRLGLQSVDCLVFHGLSNLDAWNRVIAPGEGMEQLQRCIDTGAVRFRGISSHNPEVLRPAILSGLCDVVLFPVGPFCDPRYITDILPLARAQNVGTICFKTFGAGKLVCDTSGYGRPLQERPRGKLSSGGQTSSESLLPHLSVRDCVHYTLTCDPDVALLGLSFPNEQDAAFSAALEFTPLPPARMQKIRDQAAESVRGKGRIWWDTPK